MATGVPGAQPEYRVKKHPEREVSASFRGENQAVKNSWSRSGFPDEFLLAPGTGDGDFALSPGDPDGLPAFGAVKIPVVPVFETVKNQQEFPVFLVTLIGVAGQGPENSPEHQRIAQRPEHCANARVSEHGGEDTGHQSGAEDHHIQPVRAVAAIHKAAHSGGESGTGLPQPQTQFIHKITFTNREINL